MGRLLVLSLNHDPLGEHGSAHVGGQAKYVLEIAKNLVLRGWRLDVYTIGAAGSETSVEVAASCIVRRVERESGAPYDYSVDGQEAHLLGEKILKDILIRRAQYDLGYACFWLSGVGIMPIADFLHIPFLFTFCQLGTFRAKTHGFPSVRSRIEYEKAVCSSAHGVIVTNRDEQRTVLQDYGVYREKIHFIPRGIDLEKFFP